MGFLFPNVCVGLGSGFQTDSWITCITFLNSPVIYKHCWHWPCALGNALSLIFLFLPLAFVLLLNLGLDCLTVQNTHCPFLWENCLPLSHWLKFCHITYFVQWNVKKDICDTFKRGDHVILIISFSPSRRPTMSQVAAAPSAWIP